MMNLTHLNSISATYPGFQSLPKGVKKMLLVTESLFFEDARPLPKVPEVKFSPSDHADRADDIQVIDFAQAIQSFPPPASIGAGS